LSGVKYRAFPSCRPPLSISGDIISKPSHSNHPLLLHVLARSQVQILKMRFSTILKTLSFLATLSTALPTSEGPTPLKRATYERSRHRRRQTSHSLHLPRHAPEPQCRRSSRLCHRRKLVYSSGRFTWW